MRAPRAQGTPPRRRRRRRASRTLLFTGLMLLLIAAALVIYLLFFSERERTISMTATPITAGVTKLNTGSGMLYQSNGHIYYYDWSNQNRNYS